MSKLTPERIAALRTTANFATPGPWRNGFDPSHYGAPEVTDGKTFAYYVPDAANAAFIAAASPDVVLSLLDERAELCRRLAEAYDDGEALHAELGEPYQSATVSGLRRERAELAEKLANVNASLCGALREQNRLRDELEVDGPLYMQNLARIEAERAALKAEVERLTTETNRARALLKCERGSEAYNVLCALAGVDGMPDGAPDRITELDAAYAVLDGYSEGTPAEELRRLMAEVDKLRRADEMMRPVYDAAKAWHANWPKSSTEWQLREAVNAALAAEAGTK